MVVRGSIKIHCSMGEVAELLEQGPFAVCPWWSTAAVQAAASREAVREGEASLL